MHQGSGSLRQQRRDCESDDPASHCLERASDGGPPRIRGRRTTLTLLLECSSKVLRDLIIESGIEVGMQEGMDLLEEVAVSLRGYLGRAGEGDECTGALRAGPRNARRRGRQTRSSWART